MAEPDLLQNLFSNDRGELQCKYKKGIIKQFSKNQNNHHLRDKIQITCNSSSFIFKSLQIHVNTLHGHTGIRNVEV
jgi:hypothetical protein